jgi:hypothetical protein
MVVWAVRCDRVDFGFLGGVWVGGQAEVGTGAMNESTAKETVFV